MRKLVENERARIVRALDDLASDPFRSGPDVKKMSGEPGWRLRVGTFRIVFEYDRPNRTLDVLRIADRKDVYRG